MGREELGSGFWASRMEMPVEVLGAWNYAGKEDENECPVGVQGGAGSAEASCAVGVWRGAPEWGWGGHLFRLSSACAGPGEWA